MRSNRRTPLAVSLAVLVMVAVLASCQSGDPSPNRSPSASFVATGAVGAAPLTVSFDASLSSDPDGSIVSYLWDFGTGGTGSGITTSHVYQEPGNYTARLTVTDDRGATATATAEIAVGASATGRISGKITVGGGSGSGAASVPLLRVDADPAPTAGGASGRVVEGDRAPANPSDRPAEVVAGEWIVKFRSDAVAPSASGLTVAGVRLDTVRALALPGTQLLRAPGLGIADTLAVAAELAARPDVVYAQPNYRLHALAVPNDEFYSFQWHYPAINLPAAWDITTGSTSTVVAVVDSGILFAAGNAGATHPDFAGKVLAGYDFVSNPQSSGDGDGRDPDPFDRSTGHHGSHVAGTIAAATNNGQGVAGVDWQARIVPVRVLGADGSGSLDDIIDGTLWAAGFAVSGVPANPNPAHVINLSLGGGYTCTPFEQEAFDLIESASPRRGVVVVAAGNSNQSASGFSPASCSKVITVGATEFRDFRAPYSNYGPRIDVMAPGGDMGADRNGDEFADGVLSLGASETEFLVHLRERHLDGRAPRRRRRLAHEGARSDVACRRRSPSCRARRGR
jgi:PKD repeat protein